METPNNAEERGAMLARLAELIEQTNQAIMIHQTFEIPDTLAISEYTSLRTRYVAELADLLKPIGVTVQLPTPPATGGRLAA